MDEGKAMVKKKRRKKNVRCSPKELSFSARLPSDVHGTLADSICAVKSSFNPLADFRESILEMIQEAAVRGWEEMEELVYCYLVLNSSDLHGFITDAFLSIC